MEFFATCAGGLERLLADELSGLGCARVRPLKGQVSFEGDLASAYRACLWSRLASRVVAVLARVDATDSEALYESLRTIPWKDQLRPGASLAIDAHGTNAELRNTRFVALRSKDAVSDSLYAARGSRPPVDVRHADLTVVVRIARERATVGIDLAGEPLFHRGYGTATGQRGQLSSLRADYAAALVASCGWGLDPSRAGSLLVLYPGAGTLLAEAVCARLDRAPGLLHERWGMQGWAAHDARAWEELQDEARERAEEGRSASGEFFARDARAGASEACLHLLRAAGADATVRFAGVGETSACADLVVADLSWTSSVGIAEQASALGELTAACGGGRVRSASVLTPDSIADRAVGMSARASTGVILGREEQTIRVFDLGPSRADHPQVELPDGTQATLLVPSSDQFAARLAKMARQRAEWASEEDVSCYRVYDADLPDYAVTIDLFRGIPKKGRTPGRWLSISEYAAPKHIDADLARSRLLDVLAIAPRILGVDPRNVFVRTRMRAKGGSQYAHEGARGRADGAGRPARHRGLPPGAHLVDEGGLTFEVNFSERLDCGLFLDHRDTRSQIREMAKRLDGNGRFLNLFAYTGTATCYAADGGAKGTTTVDLSKPSLDWARRNMERNGFGGEAHEFVQADVLRWVRDQRQGRKRWDLVFCDVPTFSNSNRMGKASFDVQRDHAELLIGVSRLLTRPDAAAGWKGGTCIFSCNLRSFRPDVEKLARAGVSIEDITAQTIPADFARNPKVHHCYLVRRAATRPGSHPRA